jgi:uncharacterized membrane protein SirB2
MDYIALKQLHVVCAALSYIGFFVRGVWMLRGSAMLARRWVKILPHVNDTLLLASAIAIAVMGRQYPFVHGWLTAKLVALVLYIGLGMIALRPGRPRTLRIAAWLAAQMVFLYIVWVAITRNPTPWMG